jgi:hypothetical protein
VMGTTLGVWLRRKSPVGLSGRLWKRREIVYIGNLVHDGHYHLPRLLIISGLHLEFVD